MTKRRMENVVLILTHSGDYYTVDRVAVALARRGARAFRFDTDRFPLRVKLSARLGTGELQLILRDGRSAINAAEVRAVWARKVWMPRMDESLDPQFYEMCLRESSAMMEGFLGCFHKARWVNDPQRDRAAEDKFRQLRIASDAGLKVPRTLATNDAKQVRAFFNEAEGRLVAKLLKPLSVSMGEAPMFVYTSEVKEEDLKDAQMLRHSPMVFQERIEKKHELRIAYVDGDFFTGAITASGSLKGKVDWRLATAEECRWTRAEIPADVRTRLDLLMRNLGLIYGAIDVIVTPEGEHIFLEVNPGGEWGMLERDLDLPISDAIATALLKSVID